MGGNKPLKSSSVDIDTQMDKHLFSNLNDLDYEVIPFILNLLGTSKVNRVEDNYY